MLDTIYQRLPDFIQNHLYLMVIFFGLCVALIVSELRLLTRKYKALTPAGLTQLMNREDTLVVDISAQQDYQNGHIVGAKHVAMSQFDPEHKDLAKAKQLSVAIICKTGQTAGKACERLVKAGFSQVYLLEGGMSAWYAANLPVTKK